MSPRTGRPPINNPKNIRFEVRLNDETNKILNYCAESLNITRTAVIEKGIDLVRQSIKK